MKDKQKRGNCGGPFKKGLRDSKVDEDGRVSIHLQMPITGAADITVYSCPVALSKQKWIERIFTINRNEVFPELLRHLVPANPSAALLDAIDYTRREVDRLHGIQQTRANQQGR